MVVVHNAVLLGGPGTQGRDTKVVHISVLSVCLCILLKCLDKQIWWLLSRTSRDNSYFFIVWIREHLLFPTDYCSDFFMAMWVFGVKNPLVPKNMSLTIVTLKNKIFLLKFIAIFLINSAIVWCLDYPIGESVPTSFQNPTDIYWECSDSWIGHHKSEVLNL